MKGNLILAIAKGKPSDDENESKSASSDEDTKQKTADADEAWRDFVKNPSLESYRNACTLSDMCPETEE